VFGESHRQEEDQCGLPNQTGGPIYIKFKFTSGSRAANTKIVLMSHIDYVLDVLHMHGNLRR
jgi:hypothetical protein